MRISVFGIGYVGAVTSACLAQSGHNVIAIDIDPIKVERINKGLSPIREKDIEAIISKMVLQGRLKATIDIADAVKNSEISLICVGTPSLKDGSLNLSYVEQVCADIAKEIKLKDEYHTIVLRSTMVPGSAENFIVPILEKISGKKAGEGFGFGNNPEFLREGTAIYDYYNPPKIVIGAINELSAKKIMNLYEGIEAPRIIAEISVAEGVKYADNVWHAAKISFANEIGNILKSFGVDSHKVMDIFCQDKKLNISAAYMKPGFAFGGSCLPKDIRAISASAKSMGIKTPVLSSFLEANSGQIDLAYNMVKDFDCKNICLLGLSFKAGTDDLRESPLVILAEKLLKNGFNLKIYDKNVYDSKKIAGQSKKYIEESIPHISECLIENPQQLADNVELFIIGNPDKDFIPILEALHDKISILDLVRINKNLEKRENYKGLCW